MSKSAEAFRTISEVAEVLDTPAHVLRFWESRFSQIKPVKRAGGRRYYRPTDVALLGGIKQLLHHDGLTIRGVQKILREQGARHVAGLAGLEFDEADTPPATPPRPGPPLQQSALYDPEPEEGGPLSPLRHDLSPGAEARADLAEEQAAAHRPADVPLPSDTSRFADADNLPAAALLRAMTALRDGKRREELRAIYRKLDALYRRRREAERRDGR